MRAALKTLLGVALMGCASGATVYATPTTNAFNNLTLTFGTAPRDLSTQGHIFLPDQDEDFDALIDTRGASFVVQQEVSFYPGGTTGWHSHPGFVILTLAADSGPVDWYDAKCGKTVYKAGDSWTEGSRLHDVVIHGTIPAHFFVTYVVANVVDSTGAPVKRTDQPAPKCAAALGLN